MEQGDIWLETVGPRETDGGCPNPTSRGHPRKTVSAHGTLHAHIPILTHNTCTNRVAHSYGTLDNLMLLDSGASCLVVSKSCIHSRLIESIQSTRLINADGRHVTPYGEATMTVELGQFSTNQVKNHKFVVVDFLSTLVILGCNFLIKHGYIIDIK